MSFPDPHNPWTPPLPYCRMYEGCTFPGPYPCRSLLRVPLIISDPDIEPGTTDAMMSNIDVMPTLLEMIDIKIPSCVQGKSFKKLPGKKTVAAREGTLSSGWSKDSPLYYYHTLYERNFRISYFPYQDNGELYDLVSDPYEYRNLFHDIRYRETRERMLLDLFRAVGCAEPPNLPVEGPW